MRITAFTILLIAFIIVYKDLEKLGMWEPLQDLLASSSDNMKVQVLWVIGTAVQNNPAAQKSVRSTPSRDAPKSTAKTRLRLCTDHGSQYLALNPLPTILSYLSPLAPSSQQLRSKAIYTLSGVLNHNAAAITLFETSGGWDTLRDAFSGTDRIHLPTSSAHARYSLIICCALRLGYRCPAQGRVSPQQPPHAFWPRLFDDDDEFLRHQITRRPATAGGRSGARAPELSCVDGGRSHAGRHRDRDAARITCARASARARAGAHGADAVRAGR